LNTISNETCEDLNGHGTHVAGIAGGRIYGVAKEANLFSVKVLNSQGQGSIGIALKGLEYVARQAIASKKTVVCNMSLSSDKVSSLNVAISKLVELGVFLTVAAGNGVEDACTRSPSSAAAAFTVGATKSNDKRASISNFGQCLDLFAPGDHIKSDWIGRSNAATMYLTGTSMASPFVAGAAALYIERDPSLTSRDLSAAILNDAATGMLYNILHGSPNMLLNIQRISTSRAGNDKTSALVVALSMLAAPLFITLAFLL